MYKQASKLAFLEQTLSLGFCTCFRCLQSFHYFCSRIRLVVRPSQPRHVLVCILLLVCSLYYHTGSHGAMKPPGNSVLGIGFLSFVLVLNMYTDWERWPRNNPFSSTDFLTLSTAWGMDTSIHIAASASLSSKDSTNTPGITAAPLYTAQLSKAEDSPWKHAQDKSSRHVRAQQATPGAEKCAQG